MSELIEIRWTERLESELANVIRDRCQYQPGRTALSAIADQNTFLAEFAARDRTHKRAIAAIKELLQRHAMPAIDSDIAGAMAKFQERVRERGAMLADVVTVTQTEDSAAAARAERAQAHASNRTGGNEG